jgi:outer membrane protein assembly factor BamB
MRLLTLAFAIAVSALLLPGVISPAAENDWLQWRGPGRDGISKETGLLKEWPKPGPPLAWSISNLGHGYGTVAIQGDRIYIQGTQGKNSVVFCLSRTDGMTLWTRPLGLSLDDERGGGPRGTPTVEGDRLYALSEAGDLACLKTVDGATIWSRNILRDFGGTNPKWKLSESPLIDGNNLIVTPGGDGAAIVALDKTSGKTVWTSKELSDRAAYSSCIIANVGGIRAITTLTASAAVGVRAVDGKLLWRYERVANKTANIATPVLHEDMAFYTTAYGTGCALLGLTVQDGMLRAREVYFSREMMNHHGGVVLVDGYIYGFSNAILTCMEFATGKVMWKDRSVGKGSLTYADGSLYLLSEDNTVGLAEATPQGYRERGRFKIADQGWPSWAHPVVCGGKLYIRNQGILACYGIR